MATGVAVAHLVLSPDVLSCFHNHHLMRPPSSFLPADYLEVLRALGPLFFKISHLSDTDSRRLLYNAPDEPELERRRRFQVFGADLLGATSGYTALAVFKALPSLVEHHEVGVSSGHLGPTLSPSFSEPSISTSRSPSLPDSVVTAQPTCLQPSFSSGRRRPCREWTAHGRSCTLFIMARMAVVAWIGCPWPVLRLWIRGFFDLLSSAAGSAFCIPV
jgi:hypothetical protein